MPTRPRRDSSRLYLALSLLLAACSGGGKIEGTWKVKSVTGSVAGYDDFKQVLGMGAELEMTFKDGKATMKVSLAGESQTIDMGSYKTSGDKLTINGDDGTYKVDGDTLTIKDSGGTMTLVKK